MTKKKLAPAIAAVLTALIIAAIASAQSVGLGIKKDTTLQGTGSSGSALGVNTTTLAGSGLDKTSTTLLVGQGSGLTVSADAVSIDSSYTQRRVTGTCGAGSAVTAIAEAGTVTCGAAGAADGDYGDITVSGVGTVWSVDSGAVAYSELSGAFTTSNAIPKGNGTGMTASSFFDSGTYSYTNEPLTITNGTIGAYSGPGLHLGYNFAGSVSHVWSMDPGAAFNYGLTLTGDPLVLRGGTNYGAETTALTITGNDGQFADALGITGLTTLTGGFTAGAASSMGSFKITSLANGVAASDAAAFGQISTAVSAAVSGTSNTIAKFTSANVIGNSSLTDDGTTLAVNTNKVTITESSGNTSIAGTLGTTGLITATGGITSTAATSTFGDLRGTVIEPSATSGTLNDWAPTGYATATHIALTGTAAITLNGISGGASGRILVLTNMAGSGIADITMNHENAGSTAANRLDLAVGGNWTLQTGESATFIYNGTSSRWVQLQTRWFASMAVSGSFRALSTGQIDGAATFNGSETHGDTDSDVVSFKSIIKDTGTAATLSACGTSPTITGGNTAFVITVGTGGPTACTATFASTKTNSPACIVKERSSTESVYLSSVSGTAITITAMSGTADLSGDVIDVICIGDG